MDAITTAALDHIALLINRHEDMGRSAVFSLDLHPEGAFRARYRISPTAGNNDGETTIAVRVTMQGALAALVDELVARGY